MKNKLLVSLLLAIFTLNSYAFSWQDLWQSKNQQAKEMMKKNDFTTAANTFKDENWRAVAAFRAQNYKMAADLFAKSATPEANYNLGNALAYLGKYQEAISAYDEVLKADKNHPDAAHNKKILEKLLKQQEKKQQQNKDKQQKKDETKKEKPQKNSEEQKQNTKNQQQNPPQQTKKSPEQAKNAKNTSAQKQNKSNKKDGKRQMQEQWLKLIPDDPGGLLREKFKRDYLRRQGELSS